MWYKGGLLTCVGVEPAVNNWWTSYSDFVGESGGKNEKTRNADDRGYGDDRS